MAAWIWNGPGWLRRRQARTRVCPSVMSMRSHCVRSWSAKRTIDPSVAVRASHRASVSSIRARRPKASGSSCMSSVSTRPRDGFPRDDAGQAVAGGRGVPFGCRSGRSPPARGVAGRAARRRAGRGRGRGCRAAFAWRGRSARCTAQGHLAQPRSALDRPACRGVIGLPDRDVTHCCKPPAAVCLGALISMAEGDPRDRLLHGASFELR